MRCAKWSLLLWACAVGAACADAPSAPAPLSFSDFYRHPIGPRGLEPTPRLLALAGQRVRIVGYMAQAEDPAPGFVVLAPLPVVLSSEDESLADDLPAAVVFVHVDGDHAGAVPMWVPGPLVATGLLELGARREADGRLSWVRLQLDTALAPAVDGASMLPEAAHAAPAR